MRRRSWYWRSIVSVSSIITLVLFTTCFKNVTYETPNIQKEPKSSTMRPNLQYKRKSEAACEKYRQSYGAHMFRRTEYNMSMKTPESYTEAEECITHINYLLAISKYLEDTTDNRKPLSKQLLWKSAEMTNHKILNNRTRIKRSTSTKKLEKLRENMKLYISKRIPSFSHPIEKMIGDCVYYLRNHLKKIISLTPEFPHIAAVGLKLSKNRYTFICGGSLISDKFVLTAAHCVRSQKPDLVRMGITFVPRYDDDVNPNFDYKVKDVLLYPHKSSADIALIELVEHVTFSKVVKPACLHSRKNIPKSLTITGWGMKTLKMERSNYLLKKNVLLVPPENCSQYYSTKSLISQICAMGHKGSSCMGDSGSPLQVENQGIFVIVGITSSVKGGCGSVAPSRYTDIYSYLDWIESIVWPKNFTV